MRWLWVPIALLLAGFADQLAAQWIINPQYAYGWAVPVLSLILLQRRRLKQSAPSAFPDRPGSLWTGPVLGGLLLAYLPLQLLRTANPDWRLLSLGAALHTIAACLCLVYVVGGWRPVREGLVPVLFLLIAVPWPQGFETALIQGLMGFNTSAAIEALGIAGIPAAQHGNVIEVTSGLVGVNEACSGIRSLQATLMITLFFGEFFRLPIPRRGLLILGGIGFALAGNFVRTFLLAYVGATRGIEAIHAWHDPAGVGILLLSLCGTWILAISLGPRTLAPLRRDPQRDGASRIPPLIWKFAIAVVAAYGLSLLLTEEWYRSHEKAIPLASEWTARWPEDNPTVNTRELPDVTREMLIFDEGRAAGWTTADGLQWEGIFMRWRPGQAATQAAYIHNPAVCLTASGMSFVSSTDGITASVAGMTLGFTSYVFETAGRKLHVFRCVDNDLSRRTAPHALAANWDRRNRIEAVLEGRRQRSDQRVLEIGIWGSPDLPHAEDALRDQLPALVSIRG